MHLIHKSYQLRVYTSRSGLSRLNAVLSDCARLYNAALEEWRTAYRQAGVSRTLHDQMRELTLVHRDDPDGCGALSLQ